MADPVPTGSDVAAGTYRCTGCGYPLQVGSSEHLSPCPSCHSRFWDALTDGDSPPDPVQHRRDGLSPYDAG
jgi:predicted  nucleic acid-binding Zn-ribbon protein